MKSPYGKKGGTSINAGRKAVVYEGVLPNDDGVHDSRVVRKKSFTVTGPTAYINCFKRAGVWIVGGVVAEQHPELGTTFIPAHRIDKEQVGVDPLDVPCEVALCGAAPGDPCRDSQGRNWHGSLESNGREFHANRERRAKRTPKEKPEIEVACPWCGSKTPPGANTESDAKRRKLNPYRCPDCDGVGGGGDWGMYPALVDLK